MKNKKIILLFIGLVILAGMITALEVSGKTHLFHKKPQIVATLPNIETGSSKLPTSDTSKNSNGVNTPSTTPVDNQPTDAVLTSPSGSFVSNHKPNLSGAPSPNTEQSVCITTAGASCVITFEKDGITKSLPAKTTDNTGSVSWSWTPQDISLSTGTWHITAIATLSGQTKTAQDSINLEIAP